MWVHLGPFQTLSLSLSLAQFSFSNLALGRGEFFTELL